MKEIQDKIQQACLAFVNDAAKDSKAAHARMRKATLEIAKLGKEYRRLSIEADKA